MANIEESSVSLCVNGPLQVCFVFRDWITAYAKEQNAVDLSFVSPILGYLRMDFNFFLKTFMGLKIYYFKEGGTGVPSSWISHCLTLYNRQ